MSESERNKPNPQCPTDEAMRAYAPRMYATLLMVREYFVCLEDALGFKDSSQLRRDVDSVLIAVQQYHPNEAGNPTAFAAGIDRRKHLRTPTRSKIQCRVYLNDSSDEFNSELLNVSLTGALVTAPKEIEIGTPLDIIFMSDVSNRNLIVQTVVRRAFKLEDEDHQVGCHFKRMIPYQKLRGFLRRELPDLDDNTTEVSVEEINRALRKAMRKRDPQPS